MGELMEQQKFPIPCEHSNHLPRTVAATCFVGGQAQLDSDKAVYQGGR